MYVDMDQSASLSSLLARAETGDQSAWNEIVDRFTNLLWSVCRSYFLPQDQAIDVVQTTWLRLVENLARIKDPERLPGWLTTTARNECLRHLHRAGREEVGWSETAVPELVDELSLSQGDSPVSAVDARLLDDERDAALWRCFSALSERCRTLLRVLMATDANAYAEVSEALGLPIGSIGPTRMRCLARLRQLADEAGYQFSDSDEGLCNER